MLSEAEAKELVQQKIEWFMTDLAFTAPELHGEKWNRFKHMMNGVVEEIFEED